MLCRAICTTKMCLYHAVLYDHVHDTCLPAHWPSLLLMTFLQTWCQILHVDQLLSSIYYLCEFLLLPLPFSTLKAPLSIHDANIHLVFQCFPKLCKLLALYHLPKARRIWMTMPNYQLHSLT